jgi:hypothetical protein
VNVRKVRHIVDGSLGSRRVQSTLSIVRQSGYGPANGPSGSGKSGRGDGAV